MMHHIPDQATVPFRFDATQNNGNIRTLTAFEKDSAVSMGDLFQITLSSTE